jgi:alpha-glucosidase (family GH31 glycosyl hydrolase)
MLHYPEDPNVYGLKYQWLVGSEIMVVPVVGETFAANLRAEGLIPWE